MTALLILSIVSMILIFGFGVSITVIVRRTLSDAFRTVDAISARHQKHLDTVLDRLMTIRWEDYISVKETEENIDGGFIPPEQQRGEEGGLEPPKWSHLSELRARVEALGDEDELLEEDFPEVAR